MTGQTKVELEMRTPNPVNGSHRHWTHNARVRKNQRGMVSFAWAYGRMPHRLDDGQRVRLTRISPGVLDDDNLRPALKSVRDQVAFELRIDDKLPIWDYAQERAKKHAVRIEIID